MTNVTGYPLETAVAALQKEGYRVETCLARCRKGSPGEDLRVIRQQLSGEGTVLLTYSGFLTWPVQEPE